jgi:predicted acylesterase/phospholipase RssA
MILTELCLSGACNRGICYIGCLKKFEEMKLLQIEKILGVSIGSFIAVCYIIGYTTDEMLDMVVKKNMNDFKDFTLSEQGALLKGDQYKNWVYEILSVKIDPNITLLDFYKKYNIHFITTATCIYSNNENFKEGIIYFSHELTPDVPLVVSINSSMAFPFVFPPIYYNEARFIDGGVLDNIPSGFMKKDTIKLRVNFKPIDGLTSINNPISYIGKLFELISKQISHLKNKNESEENIITICCDDFNLIDFEMSIDDKITLYKRGYKAAEKYLIDRMAHDATEITGTN